MSVVAWDGKTLAADSFAQWGNQQHSRTKVYRINKDVIAGFCGVTTDWWQAKTYLETGQKPESGTKLDFSAIVIRRERDEVKAFYMEDSLVEVPIPAQKFAIGAGADMALMAMHCYHNAQDAVYRVADLSSVVATPVVALSFESEVVPVVGGQVDVTAF